MDAVELSDEERRVYQAVSVVEAEGQPGTVHEIAARSDLPVERTRQVLSGLIGHRDLVRELGSSQPDLGPRYAVKGQPFPA
ncbi:MAG: hypothetical protein M3N52_02830 [Actinomycetota bacterium]|nr:hypothetical protein [Actinomycetota bacterium]